MKALFLRSGPRLSLEDTARPSILGDDDVIVKVTASSICGSDLHFLRGEIFCLPDFILGHEFVGVIDEVGPGVKRFKAGDRVAVPAIPYCGTCEACREKAYHNCRQSTMFGWHTKAGNLPGAQAEYVRVPHADVCLVPIPDTVSDKQALFVGDILSTAYFGVTNGELKPGDDIAIWGAGPVGLCAVACARLFTPARIILIDLEDYRLEMGLKLGATHVVNPRLTPVVEEIRKLTRGQGVNVALDAVGLPSTLEECTRAAAANGIVSVIGVGPSSFEVNMGRVFLKNLTIKSGLVPLNQMHRLMKLIENGHLDVSPIITHTLPLTEAVQGYRIFAAHEDNCIKVMLIP